MVLDGSEDHIIIGITEQLITIRDCKYSYLGSRRHHREATCHLSGPGFDGGGGEFTAGNGRRIDHACNLNGKSGRIVGESTMIIIAKWKTTTT